MNATAPAVNLSEIVKYFPMPGIKGKPNHTKRFGVREEFLLELIYKSQWLYLIHDFYLCIKM